MNILVCVKQVPDPETPPAGFKVDSAAKQAIPALGTAAVISPFDENALEAALRIKDAYGGTITALTMGPPEAEDVLRHALALGADEGFLLPSLDINEFDSYSIAYALALAARKIGTFDLILCGREAADWNAGQVGLGMAEFLGIPAVSLVKRIELIEDKLRLERVAPGGYEVVEVAPPVLLSITNELGQPRYPNLKGILAAKKKQINSLTAQDISSGSDSLSQDPVLKLLDLFIPTKERQCQFFQVGSVEEAAALLAQKIIELNPNREQCL